MTALVAATSLPAPAHAGGGRADQFRHRAVVGVRTRNRLMHDGLTFTLDEAVRRHRGQALGVATA